VSFHLLRRRKLLLESGDADFEKLVEIAVDDAQEAQPFQRRHARILGQRQHASVEFELTELAVQIQLGGDISFGHGITVIAARLR